MNEKYTKENVRPFCKGETSIRQVILKIGKTGGYKLYKIVKEIFLEEKIEIKKCHNKGVSRCAKTNEEFFNNEGVKRTTFSVRNALFKRGIKEKICEVCKNNTWNEKEIPLEVHHIDGNKLNNELSNLQILCPNCHYFTDTYKTKNIKIKTPL